MSAVACTGGAAALERPTRAAAPGRGRGRPKGGHPRAVVNPDTGRAYRSVPEAVEQIRRAEGKRLSAQLVWRAIRRGTEYGGRYWDWRYPLGWDELAMWFRLAEAGLVDWESLGRE